MDLKAIISIVEFAKCFRTLKDLGLSVPSNIKQWELKQTRPNTTSKCMHTFILQQWIVNCSVNRERDIHGIANKLLIHFVAGDALKIQCLKIGETFDDRKFATMCHVACDQILPVNGWRWITISRTRYHVTEMIRWK